MPVRPCPTPSLPTAVVVAAGALAVAVGGAVVVLAGAEPATSAAPDRLTAVSASATPVLHPGGVVTGVLRVGNPGTEPVRLQELSFAAPVADGCDTTGVALAPTISLTPEAPLEVPAGGTADVGWTAYMDGESDHDCQGATLTSAVALDGEPAGTVVLSAGRLEQPPAPTGGLTTSTRAAVHWSASTAADPGWVLERALAGTGDWQPACGSSAARPVRALSCTDTGLRRATAYTYRVTLRTGHWRATSRSSRPVTSQDRPPA